ncbi:MAG: pirin family protein [Burkholderiales bacterium]|nr:pirin family protein [Burkholderiales bacterium]
MSDSSESASMHPIATPRKGAVARSVAAVDTLAERRLGPNLVTRDAQLSATSPDLDPFLMVSLYAMRGATFPPHPHAGFMVATYILPESEIGFVNQDSIGTRNRIAPGALHVTVAGRGVLHEEQPEVEGPLAQGFQIWIDLPEAQRERPPEALHLAAEQVPRLNLSGADVRVVLGSVAGVASPLALPTAVSLLDMTMPPQTRCELALPASDHAIVFMLGGTLDAGGLRAQAGQLLRTRADGDLLALAAGPEGARLIVFAGTPLPQPRLMHGPFVASHRQQLMRFAADHAAGRFGTLQPFGRAPAGRP